MIFVGSQSQIVTIVKTLNALIASYVLLKQSERWKIMAKSSVEILA